MSSPARSQPFYSPRIERRRPSALKLDTPHLLARYILNTARSPSSPVTAGLVLDQHIDGRILAANSTDVIEGLARCIPDERVRAEVSRSLQQVSETIQPLPSLSSTHRPPTAEEVRQWLEDASPPSPVDDDGDTSSESSTSSSSSGWNFDLPSAPSAPLTPRAASPAPPSSSASTSADETSEYSFATGVTEYFDSGSLNEVMTASPESPPTVLHDFEEENDAEPLVGDSAEADGAEPPVPIDHQGTDEAVPDHDMPDRAHTAHPAPPAGEVDARHDADDIDAMLSAVGESMAERIFVACRLALRARIAGLDATAAHSAEGPAPAADADGPGLPLPLAGEEAWARVLQLATLGVRARRDAAAQTDGPPLGPRAVSVEERVPSFIRLG